MEERPYTFQELKRDMNWKLERNPTREETLTYIIKWYGEASAEHLVDNTKLTFK